MLDLQARLDSINGRERGVQQSFFNALTHFFSNGNPDSLNQTVSVANAMFDEAKASNMLGDPGTLARLSDSSGKAEAQIAAF